jgi:hypothetical protein
MLEYPDKSVRFVTLQTTSGKYANVRFCAVRWLVRLLGRRLGAARLLHIPLICSYESAARRKICNTVALTLSFVRSVGELFEHLKLRRVLLHGRCSEVSN